VVKRVKKRKVKLQGKFKDLTGQTFGKYTVLKFIGFKGVNSAWECRCICGQTKVMTAGELPARAKNHNRRANWCTCPGGLRLPKPERKPRRRGHLIEFCGESLNMAEWGARLGLSRERIRQRLNKMPIELALDPEKSTAMYQQACDAGLRRQFKWSTS
jgi:hypothetical protein